MDRKFVLDNIWFGFGRPATGPISSNFKANGLYTADVRNFNVANGVDLANKLAEVLELEDAFGYQVIYAGGKAVNPRRPQINMYAMNWLQVMVNFELCFQPADVSVAA